jgi:hypothetical protein
MIAGAGVIVPISLALILVLLYGLFNSLRDSLIQGRADCARSLSPRIASRNTPLNRARGELGHGLVHAPRFEQADSRYHRFGTKETLSHARGAGLKFFNGFREARGRARASYCR